MLRSHRLYAAFCLLTLVDLTTACKKNKTAAQPPVANPPTPAVVVAKPKRREASSNPPAPTSIAPSAPVQPAPVPHLGQMLSAEEERRYNFLIDQSLSNTRATLSSIANRSLSREQQISLQQIQDFMQQSQDTRKLDLPAAKGLADKAEVLARDLARSLR